MPTYLCHGFRWQRRSIRVYVVVQNLDDASPEWIIPAKSSQCILQSFYNLFEFLPYRAPPSRSSGGWSAYPDDSEDASNSRTSQSRSRSQSRRSFSRSRSRAHSTGREQVPPPLPNPLSLAKGTNHNGREDDISSQDWSVVKLLEEYDPLNLSEVSRPYAYVADYVKRIDLSASIFDEIRQYEAQLLRADKDAGMMSLAAGQDWASDETARHNSTSNKKSKKQSGGSGGWLEQMRDQLQRGEEIKWYVVVNGDEVRDWPDEPPPIPQSEVKRPAATKEQRQHHMQYTLQQQIFRENDRHATGAGVVGSGRKSGGGRRPMVPEKDLPLPVLPGSRFRDGGRERDDDQLKQKSQSKGGFRRLFGKNSSSSGGSHTKAAAAEDVYTP
ncbi:hypothetical protein V8F06_008580 [Rhypophila decipiens]